MRGYTIGALASACGVGRDTIRYYERFGLMPRADRTSSGYRVYGDSDVERLNFIKTAQSLGFALSEVGLLLSIRSSDTASAAEVVKLTERKIRSVSGKLKHLKAIKQALVQLVADCPTNIPASDCPILMYISRAPTSHHHRRDSHGILRDDGW